MEEPKKPLRAEQLQLFSTDSFTVNVNQPWSSTPYEQHAMELEHLNEEIERLQSERSELKDFILEQAKTILAMKQDTDNLRKLLAEGVFLAETFHGYINHLLVKYALKDGEWSYKFPDGQEWSIGFSV